MPIPGQGRRDRGAGERGGEGVVDAARVHQVLGVGDEDVRGVGPRAIDAEVAGAGDAVVVLAGFADGALAAADPRVHQPLLAHLDALGFRPEGRRRSTVSRMQDRQATPTKRELRRASENRAKERQVLPPLPDAAN